MHGLTCFALHSAKFLVFGAGAVQTVLLDIQQLPKSPMQDGRFIAHVHQPPALLDLIGGTPYSQALAESNQDVGQAVSILFQANLPGKVTSTNGTDNIGTLQWNVTFECCKILKRI